VASEVMGNFVFVTEVSDFRAQQEISPKLYDVPKM
jgi:hypothetical protein